MRISQVRVANIFFVVLKAPLYVVVQCRLVVSAHNSIAFLSTCVQP